MRDRQMRPHGRQIPLRDAQMASHCSETPPQADEIALHSVKPPSHLGKMPFIKHLREDYEIREAPSGIEPTTP